MRCDFPADLPVSARRSDIVDALRGNQVVIVAGETGSGKTTQLPKMCLEVGRRRIAHTQPRRIAARAVAERIAEEMNVALGGFVGYRVRFTDQTAADTAITVMTDGILLASIRKDRLLRAYDTIIVDEAHERSLNIDFLLGYLHWLLPRRPDLKVVITSATLDTARLSEHFDGAPVIDVTGRTYPVQVRHRPYDDIDEVDAVGDAVAELMVEGPGDILVFLSGEREIRDTADALRSRVPSTVEILPLYGRLSAAEQHRVFAPHDSRRVVLATNVAETSLTVPGIHYVVDAGSARISRFSTRLKIQRLPIEPISQASAAQRAGRCGRVADGVCIRLYAESDFATRPEFTEPEILRTNLASVILQMATLGLGDVADFPFIDAPDRRAVAAGIAVLEEIGALRPARRGDHGDVGARVTRIGRDLARIPLDPRLGRMVLAAKGGSERGDCLDDVIVLAAGLTIRDPRERPDDRAGLADAAHARFIDPTSDLMSMLALWDYVTERQGTLSSTRFRAMCREEFLNYLRVREWQDLVNQIRSAIGAPNRNGAAEHDADAIHRAMLTGLLSHVGLLEPRDATRRRKREYVGARGTRFALWPGSALASKPPEWVMAAELVETPRLWGRMAATIDPAWVEHVAGALAARSRSEPLWSRSRGEAVVIERVTLYGLPLVTDRRIPLARIDKAAARDWFIRHALVKGDWVHRHGELAANDELLREIRERLDRARSADDVVDEQMLTRFYAERIPDQVTSGRAFDAWWRREREHSPGLLDLPADLVAEAERLAAEDDFPSVWPALAHVDATLDVSYRFDPSDPRDGVTVRVPVGLLPTLSDSAFDWQVPGWRADLVTALLRALPKKIRTSLGPAPTLAERLLPALRPAVGGSESMATALSSAVRDITGVDVPVQSWDQAAIPQHLRVGIAVVADDGSELDFGRDLARLREQWARASAAAVREAMPELVQASVTSWPAIEPEATVERDGHSVTAYPSLVARADGTVSMTVLAAREAQESAMPRGTARLLRLAEPLRTASLRLDNTRKLSLARNPQGSVRALLDECCEAAALEVIIEAGGVPWNEEEFNGLAQGFRTTQLHRVQRLLDALVPVLDSWWTI
ncbi:MAG: ATP-dependent RNA helicase HrpA, partial [Actinomycetota bacterium]